MKNERPDYYRVMIGDNKIECHELIEALVLDNRLEGIEIFDYGNAIKYLFRCGQKDDYVSDLIKARNYIDALIHKAEESNKY